MSADFYRPVMRNVCVIGWHFLAHADIMRTLSGSMMCSFIEENGRDGRIRTADLLTPSQDDHSAFIREIPRFTKLCVGYT